MGNMRLIIVLTATLILHFAFAIVFQLQRGGIISDQQAETQTLDAKWSEEDAEREARQEEELQQKYGTNQLDRIAADPRMNIQLVEQKLFQAVMPHEYQTTVSVDRFTEFRVLVNVFNMPETATLAGYLKEVFSRLDPALVSETVFTDGDRFWIVDQAELTQLDWKTATTEQIVRVCFTRSFFK